MRRKLARPTPCAHEPHASHSVSFAPRARPTRVSIVPRAVSFVSNCPTSPPQPLLLIFSHLIHLLPSYSSCSVLFILFCLIHLVLSCSSCSVVKVRNHRTRRNTQKEEENIRVHQCSSVDETKKSPRLLAGFLTAHSSLLTAHYSATAISFGCSFFSRLIPPIWTSGSALIWFFSSTIWL